MAAACTALQEGGFSASENWLKECFSQAAAKRNRHKQKKRKQQQQKRQKRPRHNPTVGGGVTCDCHSRLGVVVGSLGAVPLRSVVVVGGPMAPGLSIGDWRRRRTRAVSPVAARKRGRASEGRRAGRQAGFAAPIALRNSRHIITTKGTGMPIPSTCIKGHDEVKSAGRGSSPPAGSRPEVHDGVGSGEDSKFHNRDFGQPWATRGSTRPTSARRSR